MLLRDDRTRLQHIVEAAREAIAYVSDTDREEFDASRPSKWVNV